MEIQLLFVGKTKKKYLVDELDAYKSKILRFVKFSFVCVEESKANKKINLKQIREKEFKLILKKIAPNDFVIILDEKGKMLNSIDFATEIQSYMNKGKKRIIFIIGGAFGLSNKFYDKFKFRIALSRMTFSHQMIRLFFCEQLYRAFSIINNHPYHNN